MTIAGAIGVAGFLLSLFNFIYSRGESGRRRQDQLRDEIRVILEPAKTELEYGINAAQLWTVRRPVPAAFDGYDVSGLTELSERRRRKHDRERTAHLGAEFSMVGAMWGGVNVHWEAVDDARSAHGYSSPEADKAYGYLDDHRREFLPRAEALLALVKAELARINRAQR